MCLSRDRISSNERFPDISIAPRLIKTKITKVGKSKRPAITSLKLRLDSIHIKRAAAINKARPANNFATTFFLENLFSRIISTIFVSAFSR